MSLAEALPAFWSSRQTLEIDTPWVPLGPGRALKPIRFLSEDRGYVALMQVDPGVAIPPHRHTGETHALTLSGRRELADGVQVGPGDYVYEPAGNTDTWKTVGEAPVIVLIVVYGAVEYLTPQGAVAARYSAAGMEAAYRRHCGELGIAPRDLTD
jgi:anti-sigma factor ChrR (cupin superfamily)